MTAHVPETAKTLSPGPMFSKAVDFGTLVHSFIVVNYQVLTSSTDFELDDLNLVSERTPRQI